jgi:fibro-slime domain-containing protein
VDGAWQQYMQVNSSTGGAQVRALRNGDSAPNIAGYNGQTSAKTMLLPYIDPATRKVTLLANQVIYLFELGTTSTGSTAFDMQDLVVLVDLATDRSYFEQQQAAAAPAPKDACGNEISDAAAAFGAASSGGISSAESFAQWFLDTPNQNTSRRLSIDMVRGSSNVYAFTSGDFAPINGELYGNQGLAKNRGFTFAFTGTCAYKKCAGQFFEYAGDTDAWLYVNGQLAMDMGGKHVGQSQFVDMDRLGLVDGETVTVHFFYAQRSDTNAAFSLRTNVILQTNSSVASPTVSNPFD